jgi:ATP-binding cassette, subfamily C (CFTR/MRP), member 1
MCSLDSKGLCLNFAVALRLARLAIFFFVDGYILVVALQRMSFGCMSVGVAVRSALVNAICRKSFAMASITKEDSSDCVSFVASDIQKVFDGIQV